MNARKKSGTVLERVARAANLSKAESNIARWLETELMDVPFETAGDLAAHAGVSEMTVTRFVRRLDYKNFKAFKAAVNADLRSTTGSRSLLRYSAVIDPVTTEDQLANQMKLELDAIVEVYRLARTKQWDAAIDAIHGAEQVNVVGFQGAMGLAMDFSTRLKYARPGVRFATGISGNWSEIFADDPGKSCVILVDIVPYATTSFKIAEMCLQRDIPLVTVTDQYSPWPRQFTPHALSVSTITKTFLDSTAGLSALLGLLLNGLTNKAGKVADNRLREMSALADHFGAYTFSPGTQSRPAGQGYAAATGRKDKT